MGYFEFRHALSGAPAALTAGASDLQLARVEGRLVLQVSAVDQPALLVWDVEDSPLLRADQPLAAGTGLSAPLELANGLLDGAALTWISGTAGQGVRAYSLSSTGQLGEVLALDTGTDPLVEVEVIALGGETLVYTAARGAGSLDVWARNTGGGFERIQTVEVAHGEPDDDTLSMARATVGGQTVLLALSASDNTLSAFTVAGSGALSLVGRVGADGGLGIALPTQLEVAEFQGTTYAFVGAAGTSSISVVAVGPGGALTVTDQVNDDLTTRFAGVSALEVIEADGRIYVVAAGADAGMTLMTLLPGGRLLELETIENTASNGLGQPIALTAATTETGDILVYSAGEASAAPVGWTIETDHGLIVEGGAAADVLSGTAADDILVGGAGDDRLSGGAGRDILIDGAGDDRLIGGSGADVFVLAPDGLRDKVMDFEIGIDRLDLSAFGRIYTKEAIAFQTLSNGIRLTINGERLDLLSVDRVPLTVDKFDIEALIDLWHIDVSWATQMQHLSGTAGADVLSGTDGSDVIEAFSGNDTLIGGLGNDTLDAGSGHDQLSGGAGNDSLLGGAGLDRLEDGAGSDSLTGGEGADIFALSADGEYDRIEDFELGIDSFNLSALGPVRSVEQIGVAAISGGVEVRVGAEVFAVFPAGGALLTPADFDMAVLAAEWGIEITELLKLEGTSQDDMLTGTAEGDLILGLGGDDSLEGGAGNDTLNGGDGADLLRGGAGLDTADYTGSVGSLRVDLMLPQVNTNIAMGDTFEGIENLIGSQGRDNLRGDSGDNYLWGMANVDYLVGRRGDDTIDAGRGNDTLIGGLGADMLIGGEHRDRAQYSMSLEGLTADLLFPANNTGEAAGDTYVEIEDLAGSDFGDVLHGDDAANRLIGRDGDDVLSGRGGADTLYGGAGQDALHGGSGDDRLFGGVNSDTFVFDNGHDVISDFTLAQGDIIELVSDSLALLAGLGAEEVIQQFGSVRAEGFVLDFGGSDTLTLEGIVGSEGLSEALFIL